MSEILSYNGFIGIVILKQMIRTQDPCGQPSQILWRESCPPGVHLEVRQGESMVVIGGSGSGKTVLIKCIIGLIQPDEGEIYVDGLEITSLNERR